MNAHTRNKGIVHLTIVVFLALLQITPAFAANVSGKLPNYNGSGITFQYNEVKYGSGGPGARGIKISTADRNQEYKFNPNPHVDPWYNKNQASFYQQAAGALATFYLNNGNKFPRYGRLTADIGGTTYTFGSR